MQVHRLELKTVLHVHHTMLNSWFEMGVPSQTFIFFYLTWWMNCIHWFSENTWVIFRYHSIYGIEAGNVLTLHTSPLIWSANFIPSWFARAVSYLKDWGRDKLVAISPLEGICKAFSWTNTFCTLIQMSTKSVIVQFVWYYNHNLFHHLELRSCANSIIYCWAFSLSMKNLC